MGKFEAHIFLSFQWRSKLLRFDRKIINNEFGLRDWTMDQLISFCPMTSRMSEKYFWMFFSCFFERTSFALIFRVHTALVSFLSFTFFIHSLTLSLFQSRRIQGNSIEICWIEKSNIYLINLSSLLT